MFSWVYRLAVSFMERMNPQCLCMVYLLLFLYFFYISNILIIRYVYYENLEIFDAGMKFLVSENWVVRWQKMKD